LRSVVKNMNTSLEIAKKLLDIGAVKLNFVNPFTWTSGLRSPIYCDNRKTLSFPDLRTLITIAYIKEIKQKFPETEVIAGVATAGIAQGALVAAGLNLPYCYVRPEPKNHGMKNQIEGFLEAGKKVVLIEDLISTGLSSLRAVDAVRETAEVLAVLSIFTYSLPSAELAFKNANCICISLTNLDILSKIAIENNYLSQDYLDNFIKWSKNPAKWSEDFLATATL